MLRQQVHDHVEWPIRLEEFIQLVDAVGFEVIETVIQTRMRPHGGTLFGRGKVEEMATLVAAENIEVVTIYNELTSMQKFNLQRALGVLVLDRYEVVLQVFSQEARDRISQLQLELALLQKSYPFVKVAESERLLRERPARLGGRGPGEYAYHAQLRQVRKRIAKVTSELASYRREHRQRMRKRRKAGIPMVTVVGCYNAGKTSLFNALSGTDKEVSDRPFTTLASKWSRIGNPNLLIADTIGFALDLDPELISAFQLNLDDMRAADVLLLIVDVSDELQVLKMKLESSLAILEAIGIENQRILVVLNKTDLVEKDIIQRCAKFVLEQFGFSSVQVSVKEDWNLEILLVETQRVYGEVGQNSLPFSTE
ncbi:MAG: GTPase HflX [Candidatus Hodarchaeota archaeon]